MTRMNSLRMFSAGIGSAFKSIPISAFGTDLFSADTNGLNADPVYYYKRVPWLNRGTTIITNSMARLNWDFHTKQGEVIDVPPLPFSWNTARVMNAVAGDLTLYGVSYWLKGATNGGKVKELRRFHPSSVKPIYDVMAGLTHYERRVAAQKVDYAPDEIICIALPPRDVELGHDVPPARVALAAAGLLSIIDELATSRFANGAIDPMLIALEDQASPLSDAEIVQLRGWLQKTLSGVKNAFRIEPVRAALKAVQLGASLDKLAMSELTNAKREDVATALGVPQTLLFSNAANYATAQQDAIHLYELNITPMAMLIAGYFNDELFSDYGLELVPHPERLEVFQMMELQKSQGLSFARDRNIISINEYREGIGFQKLDNPRYDVLEADNDAAVDAALADYEDAPDDAADEELRQWQRAFTKRLKAGKKMNRAFNAPSLNKALHAAIEGALENVMSIEHANAVFNDAQAWTAYP